MRRLMAAEIISQGAYRYHNYIITTLVPQGSGTNGAGGEKSSRLGKPKSYRVLIGSLEKGHLTDKGT